MGALANKQLKPKHKNTMSPNNPGEDITDPESFCQTFGESEDDFNMMKIMYRQATDDEKRQLFALLECNESAFATKGDFS